MKINYPIGTFIVENFQDFYHELLRQKERALKFAHTSGDISQQETSEYVMHSIQRRLKLLLEEQALNASKQVGEFVASQYREAQYVMVALADEIFLNLKWSATKQWENSLLEKQMFQTQIAGEAFFSGLEDLIQANDPARSDLEIVYLLSLGLGFRGKFRGKDDGGKIAWYRNQLYTLINRSPSDLFDPGRKNLLDDCYQHRLQELEGKSLPDVSVWMWSFFAIIMTYLFAAYIIWYNLIRTMDRSLEQIIEQSRNLPLT